ncbi:SDR family oxidoreductase [Amnibacterium flavum]|uniref:3-beta hydroxysteroid dehydrogenase n=1 Tax=Amnibacterium flavum TaxID=2173173 RepID=A0A2V1HY01_9MICO|nr:SDR family oxidoreductase [Amnibacterium flavum]PVZ95597.1 3-beta hydroxysteroid dehydrogenase [Amnibacterium flavum]
MQVFVTGASGWIGSAVVAELIGRGHSVTGLARSDRAASIIDTLGASVRRGSLDDLDGLRAGAEESDGVVHLGFNHDFSDYAGAGRTERAVVDAFGEVLRGSDRPLLIAAGLAGFAVRRPAIETDRPEASGPDSPRGGSEGLALSFADRGVRSISSRFAPTVHGEGDHGFVAELVGIARSRGVSGYVGDGSGRWPAVHRLDAARAVRLGFENAPAGSVLHVTAEEGVPTREIAEAIGRQLGIPAVSVPPEQADEHFGWLGRFFGSDLPASNAATRELLGWTPTHPTLLEDLEAGYYTL